MGITIKTEYEFTVRIKLRDLAVKALHSKYPETTLQQAYEIVFDLMTY